MNKNKGFTIVELVIVIAAIAILSAVLIPTFSNIIDKSLTSKALQEAKNAMTNDLIIANGDYKNIKQGTIQISDDINLYPELYTIVKKVTKGYKRNNNEIIVCKITTNMGSIKYELFTEETVIGGTFYVVEKNKYQGSFDHNTNIYTYTSNEYISKYNIETSKWDICKK